LPGEQRTQSFRRESRRRLGPHETLPMFLVHELIVGSRTGDKEMPRPAAHPPSIVAARSSPNGRQRQRILHRVYLASLRPPVGRRFPNKRVARGGFRPLRRTRPVESIVAARLNVRSSPFLEVTRDWSSDPARWTLVRLPIVRRPLRAASPCCGCLHAS
jgi:hypothetical protein